MARLVFRAVAGLLWVALATACLGGQTGQPSRGFCDGDELAATAAWGGTSVQTAAQTFQGDYAGMLRWWREPRPEPTHTSVDLQDPAQLSIAYDGVSANRDCHDRLQVPVLVKLTTESSGIVESGESTLAIWRTEQGLTARLEYEGQQVRLVADLPNPAGGAAPLVSIDAHDSSLPGAFATFTEEP